MSSEGEEVEDLLASPMALLASEIKELRNKIVSVKKSVTKGDKKQKKAIQEELTGLEALLITKQQDLQKMKSCEAEEAKEDESLEERAKYSLKAKQKKDRRREEKEAEWESNRQAALAEISNRPDYAQEESKAFAQLVSSSGFRIHEIAADGHCLFSAVGCQLDPPRDHWTMRRIAAEELRKRRADFECFIDYDSCDNIEECEDRFEEYCRRIESTGMWGGQIELEALSRGLNLTITVIQSDGPELSFNKFTDNQSIKNDEKNHHQDGWKNIYLSYHRFAFSLGEHYNALLPLDNNPNHY